MTPRQDYKTNWCVVCDEYYSDSIIDVQKHIMGEHSFKERLDALIERGAEPEDTSK
jgi:hypothetical protein